MFLMCKDVPVLQHEGGEYFKVLTSNLLPYGLRGTNTYGSLYDWISSRVVSLDRINAKKILVRLNLPYMDKMRVAIACQGLSLTDSYWLKADESDKKWADVNLFENSISKAVAHLAITGVSPLTVRGHFNTPELTGRGAYAKCWRRLKGKVWLYKANTLHGKEAEIEYICSKLLDILNIPHVKYEYTTYQDLVSSRCEIITNEDKAIVPMGEFYGYLMHNRLNFNEYMEHFYFKDYYNMLLFDGIVNNSDRHLYNWGLYMDSNTGNLLGLHPLFDHNCALSKETNLDSLVLENKKLLSVAKDAYYKLGKPQNVLKLKSYTESKVARKEFIKLFGNEDELNIVKTNLSFILS